jgi:hypothetical protein
MKITKAQSELIAFLFETKGSHAAARMSEWIVESSRYAAFVTKNKDKIRKKLRVTGEKDAAADLLHELQVPYWLLQDKRFDVEYEPYMSGKGRGPDYAVTFRSNFVFNMEITHVRGLARSAAPASNEPTIYFRLIDVLCGKLAQMRPNMANLLVVVTPADLLEPVELNAHIAWIKEKAEAKDTQFYSRQGFESASEFFKLFERLSAVMFYKSGEEQRPILWRNPQARVKLPEALTNFLQRGFSAAQD